MTTYWHMQMHPDDILFAEERVHSILESKKIIGLGEWEKGESSISLFKKEMKVNDIVAIKIGGKLIALVQVIGGAYSVKNDDSEIGLEWIVHRRPIRILDWELWGKTIPQPLGTINRCKDAKAETTKIIKEWHDRVVDVLKKRGVPISV